MQVFEIPIKDIKPYERNPRFNDNAVRAVANSIKEFGWQQPLVIDKNNIVVVGHTRLKAAEVLGMEKVPCVQAKGLTKAQIKAYRLADNKTADLSMWDYTFLDEELAALTEFDMEQFGFIDYQDDFYEGLFVGGGNGIELEHCEITIDFEAKYKEPLNDFIKRDGKEPMREAILNLIKEEPDA